MISGIINLKKEAGMTSHDAVFKLRKILKEKKLDTGEPWILMLLASFPLQLARPHGFWNT